MNVRREMNELKNLFFFGIVSISIMLFCVVNEVDAKKGQNVIERGLVSDNEIYSREILKEHKKYSKEEINVKRFNGDTLAYVTPWYQSNYYFTYILLKFHYNFYIFHEK